MNEKIIAIDVFTPDECDSITEAVLKHDPYLIDRGGFWTLGAASYQDNPKAYPAIANAFNLIISQGLGKVHDRVNEVLAEHFGKPIGHMVSGVALPSFHVFDHTSNGLKGHPHIDEPYTRVDFTMLDWSEPFSFTIPVCMPKAGAGVDFWWDATDEDIEKYYAEHRIEDAPEPSFVPYELGKVYIHDGLTPHRIASVAPLGEYEFRITLQGHGIHVEDGVIVYF